jgi:uncharacterized OB-fold protein
MSDKIKLPEPTDGPWIHSFDPLAKKWTFSVDYNANYHEDSPFFHALGKGKLVGSACKKCKYKYATPRSYCMYCGKKTEWFDLPLEGKIHSWTMCYYSGEPYLKECPFMLGLIEFKGVDTLLMTRLVGLTVKTAKIGLKVKAQFRRKKTWSVNDVYFVEDD